MNSKGLSGVPAKNTRAESDGTPVQVPDARGNEPRLYDQGLPGRKISGRSNPRREQAILKDSLYILRRDDTYHIVSENYSYKTETYYSILSRELEGKKVRPSSRAVLDAYVVPICLERAKQGGIPVCEWGISQGYVPLPSVLYGLNYFATTSDYFVVHDNEKAKEVIKHITNIGKYPFCYQKLDDGADTPFLRGNIREGGRCLFCNGPAGGDGVRMLLDPAGYHGLCEERWGIPAVIPCSHPVLPA